MPTLSKLNKIIELYMTYTNTAEICNNIKNAIELKLLN